MPTLPHDHDDMWVYQEHTRAKHEILQYYSTMWTRIVSDNRYKLRFFDCFAGRGDYVSSDGADAIELTEVESGVEFPGSPQIFLDVATSHSHLFDSAECYFFEPNDTNREHLKSNLDEISGVADNVEVQIIDNEFSDGIADLIVDSGGVGDFGLFFIDPFGLNAIPYDTVSGITQLPRFDCIITLMTSELIRWRDSESHGDMYETVYGTPNWKEELLNLELEDPVVTEAEYYSQRLKAAGTEHALAYLLTEGATRRLKYHLVFTTNDVRGFTAMRDAMMHCGTPYTLAFAPQDPQFHEDDQTQLGESGVLTESEKAKAYLLTKFAGDSIEFGELVSQCYIDRPRAKSIRKDYRRYLIELDNDGEIDIPERSDEDDSLKVGYVIGFPTDG